MASSWTLAERRAWAWPERLRPSEWIENNLVIPANAFNAEPGPYRFSRTPYWRDIADLIMEPGVKELWVYKANRVGFTQLMLGMIGYWAVQDPGAVGLLMPNEDAIDGIFKEDIKPMIMATPALNALRSGRSWDETKHELWLSSMPIIGLYSGSSINLERRALRYFFADEADLYNPFSIGASQIPKALKRLGTWGHRGRAIICSKPTTAQGNIARGYASCPDKRHFFMPCPRCGKYHEWLWAQIKGFRPAEGATKDERANWVLQNKPCYYECPNCHKKTEEAERGKCVAAGKWVSGLVDGTVWRPVQSVTEGGRIVGEAIKAERIGIWAWSILMPWVSMHQLAAEFIEAEGDTDKTRDFRNARQALTYDNVVKSIRPSVVRDKKVIAPAPLVIPKWAVAVFAAADTQKDWFALCIRAWGWGYKSQLIFYGICQTFDELYQVALESRFAVEGSDNIFSPTHLLIDSGGDRTNEVYQFALRDPGRVIPTKGSSHQMRRPWTMTQLPSGATLRMLDTNYYKDMLARLMGDPDPTKWLPHSQVTEDYCLEMASEHKVINPKNRRIEWQPTGNVRQEAWDCEAIQCAAAEMGNVGMQQPDKVTVQPATSQEAFNPVARQPRW